MRTVKLFLGPPPKAKLIGQTTDKKVLLEKIYETVRYSDIDSIFLCIEQPKSEDNAK